MEKTADIRKEIKKVLPRRPIAINFKIDPITDEYLWRLTSKHRIPVGTAAALILYWAARKDLNLLDILGELGG